MSDAIEDAPEEEHHFGKKFKHTLDSDEEDDEVDAEKYNILDNEEIEGAEKATLDFDGDIKITPFNMDEELETGHFDKEGTYIFQKEDNIRDNWLDNIDWGRVKHPEDSNKNDDSNQDDNDALGPRINLKEIYLQIVELLKPGETIQRALQRLGKDCPTVRKGQKRKANSANIDESKAKIAKENIIKLTSLADQILQTGDMDIYEKKYEEFQLHLKRLEEEAKETAASDDMFSDDFEITAQKPSTSSKPLATATTAEIAWEFKWENNEDAPIHGPHSSSEMLAWVNDGHFKDGVFVRKTDSGNSDFYSSKRIDFDLYI